MWDPQGAYLLPPAGAPPGAPVAKQYRHVGSDLPARFADQFAVWGFGGGDVRRRTSATLIRLPLRTAEQVCAEIHLRRRFLLSLEVVGAHSGRQSSDEWAFASAISYALTMCHSSVIASQVTSVLVSANR